MSKYKNEEDMITPPIDTFIDKNVMSNQLLKKYVDNTTMPNLILDAFKNKKENQMAQYNNEDISMDPEQMEEILRQRKMAEDSIPVESNPNLINRTPDSLSKEEIENSLGSVYKTLGIKKPTPIPSQMEGPEMSPMMSLQEVLKKYHPHMLQPKAPDVYAPSEASGPFGPEISDEMAIKRLHKHWDRNPELGSKSNLDRVGGELPKSLIEALGDSSSNYMNSNVPFAGVDHNVFPKTKQKLKRIDLNPDGSHKSFHFDTSGDTK